MSDVPLILARAAWDLGRARIDSSGALTGPSSLVADATEDEVRRRVGATFTLAQLAVCYRQAATWFLPLASRVAPGRPEAWDVDVVLDGVFGRYQRQASDWGRDP